VPVKLLGEAFTLYRGESGKPHLVADRCPDRLSMNPSMNAEAHRWSIRFPCNSFRNMENVVDDHAHVAFAHRGLAMGEPRTAIPRGVAAEETLFGMTVPRTSRTTTASRRIIS
jgi:phenylpropionate dioxygenase-like ring-hydroxylating dioxygenase large terminal subunit